MTVASSPAAFTWVNDSLIQVTTTPANGAVVRVYRTTPLTAPLVDFADGATLVAADLDTNSRQSIYTQQELDDALAGAVLGFIPNGNKGDITTSAGSTVWTVNSGLPAAKSTFTQSGTGAVARTVDSKLKDVVSVKDFGAVGNGVADDTTAFTNAFNFSPNVYAPPGVYNVTGLTKSVWSSGGASFVGTNGMTVKAVNTIDPESFDLSWLITKDGNKVVITGDSLSYNRYDFDLTARTNAYDCLPGMMSWSFMLRDFINRADPWFDHADQLDFILSSGGTISTFNGASDYTAPFNNRYVTVAGTGASSEVYFLKRVNNEQTGKLVLYCMSNPNASGDCLCDVRYSLYPYTSSTLAGTLDAQTGTNYQGFEPFAFNVPCGSGSDYPVKIIFTNFRLRSGSAIPSGTRGFFLLAAGTKNTPVYLTGRGGWTASEVNTDFTNRIGQYAPDLLIMITGANDRFYGTKEAWATGMVNIINATKALKPYCQIVCLGAMPASDTGYSPNEILNGSTMREFLEYGKKATTDAGAIWFDNYSLFRGVDPAVWRFDNVHMTKRGNKILFDALVGRFLSVAPGSKDYYDPTLQAPNPKIFQEQTRKESGFVYFTFNSGTLAYTIDSSSSEQDAVIKSITRTSAYSFRVTFNYNLNASLAGGPRIGPFTLIHTGSSAYWINNRVQGFGVDYIDYFLIDQLSNALLSDAINNNQGYTLFY